MTTYQIYRVTAPDGASYIGATKSTVKVRWRQHVRDAKEHKRGAALPCESIRQHGASAHTLDVLATATTKQNALAIEAQMIELHDTLANGLNSRIGTAHTPETRAKIAAAHTGAHRSAETREKMRVAKLGRNQPWNRGSRQGNARLAEMQVIELRHRRQIDPSLTYAQLAQQYGVSVSNVYSIISGKSWGHLMAAT